MDTPGSDSAPVRKSLFVTVIAWLMLVSSALGTLVTGPQALVANVTGMDPMTDIRNAGMESQVPAAASFMVNHYRLFTLMLFIGSAGALTVSIGLLRRRNWARLSVIGMLAIGSVNGFIQVYRQHSFFRGIAVSLPVDSTSAPGQQQFSSLMPALHTMALVMATLFAVVSGLIIAKLCSARIREEFAASE